MTITQITIVQGIALQPGPPGTPGPQGLPGTITNLDILRGWMTLQYVVPTDLTFIASGTVAWDTMAHPSARLAISGGNAAMGSPINVVEGAYYALRIVQDTTPRVLTWQAGAYLWPNGANSAVQISNSAGAVDIFHFRGSPAGALEFVGAQLNIRA
jgi:hypothetical protein